MNTLRSLLGPSLNNTEKPSTINTEPSWLGLSFLFLTAQASKCFLSQQKYHERTLDVCDIGEELLSGVELLNDAKSLVAHSKWAVEVYANPTSNDFTAKRVQIFSKFFFSMVDIFCNGIKGVSFLARIHLISLSSDLQKRLEKVNDFFYLFTQVFYLFQEGYQNYLNHTLSCHSESETLKKELNEKCRLSLLRIAEISLKISLEVFKKNFKKLDTLMLALSSCVLVLKISAYLYDSTVLFSHKGKFSLKENGFAYGMGL
ncbi:hypothetical protein [Candidatus Rhabdochlamydia porcellionis]|uniref:Uncharacterized protein n=1 Tax=Candidatus Rhabdochlamydia porcellionis TaxID=225148 RepID=A0ABX8YZ28_9BACT|nr:hypothetical protein [Candidatus Rhabdochlamydia porcellionis]QZA58303.1 hypothetical protein RHAB15C_0000175 [Candidatus Rhabdochlamydia porcellionis]